MPICKLQNGERVHFHLIKRPRDKYFSVEFVGPAGKVERSTKETAKKPAEESSLAVIAKEFATPLDSISWDDAIKQMELSAKASNRRTGTIEQYIFAVKRLREVFPHSHGPSDITPAMATKFMQARQFNKKTGAPLSQRTIQGNFTNLNTAYNRWFKIPSPFASEDEPKVDKKKPRVISDKEDQAWRAWLNKRWNNWRLPQLFLEVKALIGCRIGELTSVGPMAIAGGRITFEAQTAKGRKERSVLLPKPLYRELKKIAGATYVFESFAEELKKLRPTRSIKPYSPKQLKKWFQRQLMDYRESNPNVKYFKLHNYRGTALSKARTKGIEFADAALIFGVDEKTAKIHYENIDEQALSDAAMKRLIGK